MRFHLMKQNQPILVNFYILSYFVLIISNDFRMVSLFSLTHFYVGIYEIPPAEAKPINSSKFTISHHVFFFPHY